MNTITVAPNDVFAPSRKAASESSTLKQPTTLRERISSIDVLRGLALLGILMMNIDDFGTPEAGFDIPIGMPKPAFVGPHAHLNLAIVILKWVFFEGKMRAIFSMLFGAGVVLAEKRGADGQIADIYLRRNMWLLLLGFLHALLLWNGDILFLYALTALLALYPLRNLQAKTLLLAGTFISLVLGTCTLAQYTQTADHIMLHRKASIVAEGWLAGRKITPEQEKTLAQWTKLVDEHKVTEAGIQEELASAHASYWTGLGQRFQHVFVGPGAALRDVEYVTDALGAMMIGMGLFKAGFLTAESSYATYAWTAAIGFLLSAPLYVIGILKAYASGFFFLDIDKWLLAPYYFPREAGSIAIAAVVMIAVKSGVLGPVQRALAAVGQTALTNYLLTTVICQFLFLWSPWKLYGKLEYYQLTYVVFFVWAINLIVSPLWLRVFRFGPVEWLWRSLTYVKLQPMLKRRSA